MSDIKLRVKGGYMREPVAITGLIKDLVQNHHTKVSVPLQELEPLVEKIARVHGSRRPELRELATLFSSLTLALHEHLAVEEKVWFPHMMRLIDRKPIISRYACCDSHHENSPEQSIHEEHGCIKQLLERMRVVTSNYHIPSDACGTYRRTMMLLKELEAELLEQMDLEEKVLIPEVRALDEARTLHSSGS